MLFDENMTGVLGGGEPEPELGDYVTANTAGDAKNPPYTIQGIFVLKNQNGTVVVHHGGKDVVCSDNLTVVPERNLDAETREAVRKAKRLLSGN